MTESTPWSLIVPLDRIQDEPQPLRLEAPAAARAALAARFDLAGISRFAADLMIGRQGDGVRLRGQIAADIAYHCRVSREPFDAHVSVPLDVLYLPETQLPAADEIGETVDPWDLDALDPRGVDVAESAAVTLALALDPYPRSPNADADLKRLGILSEDEDRQARNPFAVLATRPPEKG